jgi:hypothetical protein
MANLASGHPALRTIQSLFRAMVEVAIPATRGPVCSKAHVRPTVARSGDAARSELTRVGNLLLDALRLEQEYSDYFADFDNSRPHEKQLEQWRECRRIVEQLTEDYVSIISRWRAEIEHEVAEDGRDDVSMLSTEALLRSSPNC